MRSLSRRDLFPALGATALAGIAAAGFAKPETLTAAPTAKPEGKHSDARLIALCEEFIANEAKIDRLHGEIHSFEDEEANKPRLNALYETEGEIFDKIVSQPATSIAALQAKVKALKAYDRGEWFGSSELDWGETMMVNILSDIVHFS